MKRNILVALLTLASSSALAAGDSPDPQQTPPTETSPTGAKLPSPSNTESATTTTTTKPVETPKKKEESSWFDKVKLSGRAYLRYSYELAPGAQNFNEFALDRLYLQSEYFATDKVRFQATLDAADTRNSTGNNVFLAETKYAFAEVKDVLAPGVWFRGGIIPLAFVPYEEDLWGYRVQGLVALDRWGYQTSSDLGVAVGGNLPAKHGSFQVNVNNMEGYKAKEIGKRKELQARLTVNPLASLGGWAAGLFVTGYGSYGEYDDTGLHPRTRSRVLGQVGIQTAQLTLAGDYFVVRDTNAKAKARFSSVGTDSVVSGQGVSIFGALNMGLFAHPADSVELVWRYDHIDPDKDVDANSLNLYIAGAAYKWTKTIKTLADYEAVTYAANFTSPGVGKAPERRLKLQTEFRF